ncbi:RNA polymerase sigma factor [Termitidicoccus mucosus]|uniref:RNA polymerase sigma factor n=1 Tax=Termitidicoccus mucosus TaxID=1184151 RepID=UPI002FEDF738
MPTDDALMARLQAGDERALDELMTRWELPVRRYLHRHLQNEAAALDIAEEAFVRVYQQRHRFAPGSHFTAWLFTIATNLARSHHRWRARHPSEAFPDGDGGQGDVPVALREDATPADALRRQEKIEAVRHAVSVLSDELRTVTLLYEYENLSHAEIASVLHCSAKAVETRLYRARKRLRAILAPYFGGDN